MAIEGKVRTLYTDKTQQEAIFPTTKVSAVTDDEGNGLNTLLEHIAYVDPTDMESAAVLANADTLGGYPASDYAFVEDLKNLKPEDIGAAPDGYGLGTCGRLATDFNALTANGWYRMAGADCVNVPTTKIHFQYGHTFVENRDSTSSDPGRVWQTLKLENYVARRFSEDGGVTWSELEFENPPMQLDVEYRTTERWNGKPVYTKLIDCYNLPDIGTEKTVTHNTGGKMIAITGHLSTGDVLPYINDITEIKLSTTPKNIIIQTVNWGFSSEKLVTEVTATVRIWYIKD